MEYKSLSKNGFNKKDFWATPWNKNTLAYPAYRNHHSDPKMSSTYLLPPPKKPVLTAHKRSHKGSLFFAHKNKSLSQTRSEQYLKKYNTWYRHHNVYCSPELPPLTKVYQFRQTLQCPTRIVPLSPPRKSAMKGSFLIWHLLQFITWFYDTSIRASKLHCHHTSLSPQRLTSLFDMMMRREREPWPFISESYLGKSPGHEMDDFHIFPLQLQWKGLPYPFHKTSDRLLGLRRQRARPYIRSGLLSEAFPTSAFIS